jgi:hypothetical protein
MSRLLALLTVMLAVVLAAAQVGYRVDPEGGPDDLGALVADAFAAWTELDAALEAAPSDAPDAPLVRYGTPAAFGPDALTLTVQRQTAGERTLEVLVNPGRPENLETALLHETGLLLGLSVGEAGVMNPAIGGPLELGETEAAELEAGARFIREDIDRSGAVDFYDLLALARAFGQTGVNLPADLNEDGVVDQADLELLRAAYTFSPPSETPPTEPGADLGAEEPLDALPDLEDAPEEALPNPENGGETGEGEPEEDETGE